MMKLKIFISSLFAALFFYFSPSVYACGEIGGPVSEYLLYRVYDDKNPVYCRPVIEQLRESDDPEVIEYLKLASTCEEMRIKMNSKWYYPSKNDVVTTSLEGVLQKSLEYKGTKLKDRYALQAARAMFSLGRFEQMCRWWNEVESDIAPGAIREHIIGYVAGAKYRTGDTEAAFQYYAAIGDVQSIEYCLRQEGRYDGYLSIAECCKEYPSVFKTLQNEIKSIEVYYNYYLSFQPEVFYDYYDVAVKNAEESLDPAPWLYTAAFMKYMQSEYYAAQDLVLKAEKCSNSQFMSDSIRVLRILIDAELSAYNKEYETKLLEDLMWLDKKSCENLTDEIRQKTAEEGYYLKYNASYYYWNDMMRKIVLGTVVPKMVKAGKTPLALLLANYADNRLLALVDRVHTYKWVYENEDYVLIENDYTLSEYRKTSDVFNMYDYSNHYFELLDNDDINISSILEYSKILDAPSGELQNFLAERVYIDDDYLNDLIGTRYLRIRRYKDAHDYLSMVSKDYQTYLNTYEYMRRLPFHYYRKKGGKAQTDYKLNFAKEMLECEEIMFRSSDPNKVGHARIKYGIGMKNSHGWCWALTRYKCRYYDYFDKNNRLLVIGERQIRSGLDQQTSPNHCDVLKNYY